MAPSRSGPAAGPPASTLEFLRLQEAVAGRYSLVREIGRGGMGIVYLAQDVALERPVAIKLLPPPLAQEAALRERFLREARTAAQLMHPHVVPIHAVEEHGDLVFFVMAFVDGETVTGRVSRSGPLAPDDALRVMKEVAWALAYAHGKGVVHRDIKPDNILLEHGSGRAMVADFGIARVASRDTLSAEGTLVGTLAYMSPEQASAEVVDARSDVFSLGATIWFALTGSSPVEAPSLPAMLTRLLTETPLSILAVRPECPPALAEALGRALARDREQRFPSADALSAALLAAERPASVMRPEIRRFLRELPTAKLTGFAGLASAMLAGASAVAGLLPSGVIGPVLGVAATLVGLSGVAVVGELLSLQRTRIPFGEVIAGIDAELREYDAARRVRVSDTIRSAMIRRIGYLGVAVGGLSTGLAIYGARFDGRLDGVFLRILTNGRVDAGFAVFLGAGVLLLVTGLHLATTSRIHGRIARWVLPESPPDAKADRLFLRTLRSFLGSRTARWMFADLPGTAIAAPRPIAPTATLLLQRVEELAAQLPSEVRARLGDLVPTTAHLERAHAELRGRLTMLDAAIAELPPDSPARADFGAARARTAARLAECVEALEGVRADLLRLTAGLIDAGGITRELERARELGAAIDAELHGVNEVRRLLAD